MRKINAGQRWILITAVAVVLASASTVRAGYTLTTLASFNGSNGKQPLAPVILSGNTLYGTASYGGYYDEGTAFSVPISGGTPTVLTSFSYSSNGMIPLAGLTLSGNTLYGTTYGGGTRNEGTVFSIPTTGGTPTIVASLTSSTGDTPEAALILSATTLYGTTVTDGPGGYGTVFSVPVTGGTPTVLASFSGSNGHAPHAGLILSGNTLYGTTVVGGANGYGTVFSVPITGGPSTVLASFNGSNGSYPLGGLVLSGNTLYGTTCYGGTGFNGTYSSGDGLVFSVPVTGGDPTVLASFNGSNGKLPAAGLTLSGNTLYGTTSSGGPAIGEVFSVPVTGGPPTVIASFRGSNVLAPYAAVTLSGNILYGTSKYGGGYGYGAVFAIDLTKPTPINSVTVTAPTAFGSQVGTLTLTGSCCNYNTATATFAATRTGYLAVCGFNPSTDTEIYALHVTDSVPANLAADLADAASELSAASYSGYSLTASTTDPTGGSFGTGYDFYFTITGSTLGTGSPYFGFDFTQLNGITDTLSANAVGAVPEPVSLALFALGGLTLLRRRRRRSG